MCAKIWFNFCSCWTLLVPRESQATTHFLTKNYWRYWVLINKTYVVSFPGNTDVCSFIVSDLFFFSFVLQQIAFKNLVQRNQQNEQQNQGPPSLTSTIQLPFLIVNTSKRTIIDCSISSDKWVYMEFIFIFLLSLWTGIFPQTSEGNFSSLLEVIIVFMFATVTSGGCLLFFLIFNATAVIIWMSLLTLLYSL